MKYLEIDKKYRIFYNKGNPNNQLIHVRAIVDKEYIVYKTWFKRKQYWRYSVDNVHYFKSLFFGGNLTEIK